METQGDYLKEFCNYHRVFQGKNISQSNINKISHNFGVDDFYLHGVKNLNQLVKIIKEYKRFPTPIEEETSSELINLTNLQLAMYKE